MKVNLTRRLGSKEYARFGKCFKTKEKKYFYDTGTGKVCECEQEEYELLNTLIDNNNYNKVVEMLEEPQYYLKVFLTDGDIPIDNSASERSIRTFCVGKKNWMFHNTANGANASALIYSISETAKLNNLRPYNYFKYILTELPKHCDEKGNIEPADLDYIMPWSEQLPEECRKPRRS